MRRRNPQAWPKPTQPARPREIPLLESKGGFDMSVEIVDAPAGVFAARSTGQLRSSEYKQLQQRAAEYIQKHGSARILIETQDFMGFDRGNWEDNSFQSQFDQKIEKIAI